MRYLPKFCFILFALLACVLSSAQIVSPKPTTDIGWKEIVVGTNGYYADSAAVTGTSLGGANCSALMRRQRHTIKTIGFLKGAIWLNTSGGGSPVLGEGTGPGNTMDVYGNLLLSSDTSKLFPLYSQISPTTSRALTLANNGSGEMRLDGKVFVSNETVYSQISYEVATASALFPTHRTIMFTQLEDANYYTNVTPSVNVTSSRAKADTASYASYAAGNRALDTTMSGLTLYPSPAGLIVEVPVATRHFAIIGTSRSISQTNILVSTTGLEDDGFCEIALNSLGYTYVNLSKSSSRMYQDIIPAYATRLRNGLLRGVTDIILEHGQNDLANRTLAEFQGDLLTFNTWAKKQGIRVWLCTIDPWVQKASSTGNALDEYYNTGYPIADATTETERLSYNSWLRGSSGGLAAGGSASIKKGQVCFGYFDTASKVENSSSAGQWLTGVQMDSGTVTALPSAPSTTLFSDNTKNWTPLAYHDMLVRFGSGGTAGWGYLRTNGTNQVGRCHASTTFPATQITTWGTGSGALTPTAGQSYEVWKAYTKDGIHASYWGRVLKATAITSKLATNPLLALSNMDANSFNFYVSTGIIDQINEIGMERERELALR